MTYNIAPNANNISYQDTVINYMKKDGGHVMVLTDDQAFSTQPVSYTHLS